MSSEQSSTPPSTPVHSTSMEEDKMMEEVGGPFEFYRYFYHSHLETCDFQFPTVFYFTLMTGKGFVVVDTTLGLKSLME